MAFLDSIFGGVAQPSVAGAGSGGAGGLDAGDLARGAGGIASGAGSGYSGEINDRRENQNKSGNLSFATQSTSTGPTGSGTRGFVINIGSGSLSTKDSTENSGLIGKWALLGLGAMALLFGLVWIFKHRN
jgi:hypothetical protein